MDNQLLMQMLNMNMQIMTHIINSQSTGQPTTGTTGQPTTGTTGHPTTGTTGQPTTGTTGQPTTGTTGQNLSGAMTIQDFISLQQLFNGRNMTQQTGQPPTSMEGIAAQIINPTLPEYGSEPNGGIFADGKRHDIYASGGGFN